MKYVVVVLCFLFSTVAFANSVSSYTCTDKEHNATLKVKFDNSHPDSIEIGSDKFLFVDENTVGDLNKVWYYNSDSTVYFSFSLTNQKVSKMHVKMNSHINNSNFISGECK